MTASLAVMMVISRRHQGIPVMQAACVSALLSGFVAIPFAADLAVSGIDLINLALFGLVNSAIGLALFTLGSRMLPAIETGLIGSLDAPLAPSGCGWLSPRRPRTRHWSAASSCLPLSSRTSSAPPNLRVRRQVIRRGEANQNREDENGAENLVMTARIGEISFTRTRGSSGGPLHQVVHCFLQSPRGRFPVPTG